jgi:1-aminocyclopropane-1-carboxylate deaminase
VLVSYPYLIGCENNNFASVASMNISFEKIRTESIKNLYHPYGPEVDVLRLDLIHNQVSGNKWFKLMNYLEEARAAKKDKILTFGGAYSNHILATAVACRESGLRSIGIIRGEQPPRLSQSLVDAMNAGMELVFISREEYRTKKIPASIQSDSAYIINEGGYGIAGRDGAGSIMDYADPHRYTDIICACGTGTTLAGLVNSAMPWQQITGISVLKNEGSLETEINALLPPEKKSSFTLLHDFHFGGYAKFDGELIDFMNEFFIKTAIPSDFVYTGKLFFAVDRLIKQGRWSRESRLLLVHSGGLQGNRSLDPGKLIFSTG